MKNNKIWLIVGIVIVVLLIGSYMYNRRSVDVESTTESTETTNGVVASVSTTSTKSGTVATGTASTSPSVLVLYEVTPSPVRIGQPMTVTGKGFNVNDVGVKQASLTLTIKNGAGKTAILWNAAADSRGTTVVTTLPAKLCTYVPPSGTTCTSYLNIMPGDYSVVASLAQPSLASNAVFFVVK